MLDGSVPPGVYRWEPAPQPGEATGLLARATAAGWHSARLDLVGTRDKAAFLDRCAADLDLPAWFGHNWDALADCLTDLSWAGEPAGHLFVATGWPDFVSHAPAEAATAADILSAAAAYWAARSTPFTVLLA